MLGIVCTLFDADMQVAGYGNYSLAQHAAEVGSAEPTRSVEFGKWNRGHQNTFPKRVGLAIEEFHQIRRYEMVTTSTELKAVNRLGLGHCNLANKQRKNCWAEVLPSLRLSNIDVWLAS